LSGAASLAAPRPYHSRRRIEMAAKKKTAKKPAKKKAAKRK
jgi:hypothetical protein